ncbi:MAG TPA: PAS domain S-box protein [Actinomycetota bacterium]|nr:PAS domain S-box protein [Actinomycetota bacterium]
MTGARRRRLRPQDGGHTRQAGEIRVVAYLLWAQCAALIVFGVVVELRAVDALPAQVHVIVVGLMLFSIVATVVAGRLSERALEDVRRFQGQFRDAFHHAPIGMALVDLDGRWIEVNAALERITGYTATQLSTMCFQDITHPDDLEHDLDLAEKLLAGEIPTYQLEKRYVRADGEAVPILLSVTLVRNAAGEPLNFVAQIQDITKHKEAQGYYKRLYEGQAALSRELSEAHRLKQDLFNIVSHEFKTPLASIIGFAGLLSRKGGGLSDEQLSKYLDAIVRQGERLNRLVENLFVSGREIDPSETSVGSVEDALAAVQEQLSDTYDDVGLDVTIAPDLRPCMSQEALRLVLLNLASNAIKHSDPDSVVQIVAGRADGRVAISVLNRGEPIPEEQRERIFDPFVQSTNHGRTADGVGLGLYIVRRLVTAYGGTVSLTNGQRCVTFTIEIPEARRAGTEIELDPVEAIR